MHRDRLIQQQLYHESQIDEHQEEDEGHQAQHHTQSCVRAAVELCTWRTQTHTHTHTRAREDNRIQKRK